MTQYINKYRYAQDFKRQRESRQVIKIDSNISKNFENNKNYNKLIKQQKKILALKKIYNKIDVSDISILEIYNKIIKFFELKQSNTEVSLEATFLENKVSTIVLSKLFCC